MKKLTANSPVLTLGMAAKQGILPLPASNLYLEVKFFRRDPYDFMSPYLPNLVWSNISGAGGGRCTSIKDTAATPDARTRQFNAQVRKHILELRKTFILPRNLKQKRLMKGGSLEVSVPADTKITAGDKEIITAWLELLDLKALHTLRIKND